MPPMLLRLVSVMEEQVDILRRMDDRQRAGDLSKQPMPEVPATSSSAWNALLKSTLAETIHPKVERWRSGLDALLVFLGLFSAIVTSFFVQSLTALQEDQSVRMNQLVANLTDIIIALSGVPPSNLAITHPTAFRPDSTDVRLNAYWSLSLILSLSIAALAVSCRGYLNMVGWSRFTKASEKLIDIRTRWLSSERFLGPTIELLPQMLVVPVLLFIAGLLDTLFSSVLQLSPVPLPILFTSGLSLLFITAVAVLLGYTLTQRSINPTGTGIAFQWMSELRNRLEFVANSSSTLSRNDTLRPIPRTLRKRRSEPQLTSSAHLVYHDVVQSTHDDDTLNEASAALYSVIQTFSIWPRYTLASDVHASSGLLAQERATLLHLLSPEATNRIRYSQSDMEELVPALLDAARLPISPSPSSTGILTSHIHSRADLWDSPFVRAMAVVGNVGTLCSGKSLCAPALAFLASEYIDVYRLPSDSDPSGEHALRTRTIGFVAEMLFRRVAAAVEEAQGVGVDEDRNDDPEMKSNGTRRKRRRRMTRLDNIVRSVLEPLVGVSVPSRTRSTSSASLGDPKASSSQLPINTYTLLSAFVYLPLPSRATSFRVADKHYRPPQPDSATAPATALPNRDMVLTLLLRWLVHRTSPLQVIGAAQAQAQRVTIPDVWPTVLFFVVATLARTLLDLESESTSVEEAVSESPVSDAGGQSEEESHTRQIPKPAPWLLPLAHLCVSSLAKIATLHQFHPQLPALVGCAAQALQRHWELHPTVNESTMGILRSMQDEVLEVRRFVADGTWRWSAKQREAVLKELEALEQGTIPPEDLRPQENGDPGFRTGHDVDPDITRDGLEVFKESSLGADSKSLGDASSSSDGTWRWSAKQREAVLKELEVVEQGTIPPELRPHENGDPGFRTGHDVDPDVDALNEGTIPPEDLRPHENGDPGFRTSTNDVDPDVTRDGLQVVKESSLGADSKSLGDAAASLMILEEQTMDTIC
ncbi:hypothetical protein C8F01DRAFT_1251522 [Mycena amicta]|nr:hypothetical protein C8F01DRAFT_1251522 [Mycena amicta]